MNMTKEWEVIRTKTVISPAMHGCTSQYMNYISGHIQGPGAIQPKFPPDNAAHGEKCILLRNCVKVFLGA